MVRYAKYAAVGAVAAVLGGTLLGTLGSGLAFFAAPGILGGMGIGLATAVAMVCLPFFLIFPLSLPRFFLTLPSLLRRKADVQFGWRHRGDHLRGGIWEGFKARAAEGRDGASDEKTDAESVKRRREEENKQTRRDVWMRA